MSDSFIFSRRHFLKSSSALVAAGTTPVFFNQVFSAAKAKRKFKLCLNPGSIGVKANQKELLQLAVNYGYEAIVSMPDQLGKYSDMELNEFLAQMKESDICWGSTNLPVEFRKDEATFQEGLANLPATAKALKRAGARRINTWILNGDDQLTYLENFKQHASRLRACAKVLSEYDIRFGIEYVGPKTSMIRKKYPFLRTMAEARELISEIGVTNMGLVLDSFHWYCADDTVDDILSLDKKDIITCDLNDARADLSKNEQIDGTRELPGATGVIDLKSFLQALVKIKYDGPVRSEPFNKALNELDNEDAVKTNYQAMKKSFDLIG